MLAHHPCVHTARVHTALACNAVGEPQRFERRSRAHHRDRLIAPSARQVFGHDVEWVGHDERDSRQLARLDGGRDDIHDHDVLVEDVESALARRRVVAGGHDEDVLALDLVEAAPAHLNV